MQDNFVAVIRTAATGPDLTKRVVVNGRPLLIARSAGTLVDTS